MTVMIAPFAYADHGHLIVETSSNDGLRKWRNSIDVVWNDSDGPPGPAETVVTKFYEFLQGIQRADCHLSAARLAVWAKGNLPLADQPAFWESTLDLACASTGSGTCYGGTATLGTTPPGEICVLLKKNVFGRAFRAGNMFIRNSINQEFLESTAGGPPALESSLATSVPAAVNTWAASKLAAFCEANPLPRYCLVHAQKQSPDQYDVFESQITSPVWARLTMHDIGRD
jgi:hypothetical protein